MRKIFCGSSGYDTVPETHLLREIPLRKELVDAFCRFYGDALKLRPAQEAAIFAHNLLSDSANAILSTPTNSGKSLLSYLLLFSVAAEGGTAVLVEPLRALAYEKSEEIRAIADILRRQHKIKISISVSTGDYRLNDDFLFSAPAQRDAGDYGHIVIATPERLDALSRAAENKGWFEELNLTCFDEAHLIGDSSRGATLELLIAFLKSVNTANRLILMSATISNADELAAWLQPCQVIAGVPRYPKLDKWVYCLEEEEANDILLSEIQAILQTPGTSVLVFVYQTASAESLAGTIAAALSSTKVKKGDLSAAMRAGVAWFHSKLSSATKIHIVQAMSEGQIRVVVSTTALSMGINLPATHVFVRDITFSGVRDLDASDLLQMIGRAGRGDRCGNGVILLGKQNIAKEAQFVKDVTDEVIPSVKSRLLPVVRDAYYGAPQTDLFFVDRVGSQLMGILHRYGSITEKKIADYLENTLCGNLFEELPIILKCLTDWKLAHLDEDTNEYQLTHLGEVASQCYLPPLTAANFGQLFRDLLSDKRDGSHISQLTPIDLLIILCIISDENRPIARYSKSMKEKVKGYMEGLPLEEKSYLFRTWAENAPDALMGSCDVTNSVKNPEKYICQCIWSAMLIYDISRGISPASLRSFYGMDTEEIQEKLRDNAIWILCGLENLMEVKSFYYHLKTNCEAETEDIASVDQAFRKGSKTIFALIANLKYRSKLGEMVRSIKRIFPGEPSYPGDNTLRKLQENGINTIKDIVGKSVEDLAALGIRHDYAALIVSYIKKRAN